jgi:multidrug efflux system membrane fusion protein
MNKNKRNSILMAVGVVVTVTLWMLSGLGSSPVDFSGDGESTRETGEPMRVRVEQIQASEVTREVVVSARTEPNRFVRMKAETDGTVIALGVERGTPVPYGETIVELDMRDRSARLAETDALIAQRELELTARQNLRNRDFVSQVEIAEANALLQSARAAQARIVLEIDNISIDAPFDGIVQDRAVEIGDYVRAGDDVVEIVDIDPLIITGEINGKEISELYVGGRGAAVLVDGTRLNGILRYLAPVADENTRTFRVELEVPNPYGIRAGLTAEMQLDGSRISAHDISASLLTLADDGTVGVKTVNNRNRVDFYPVEIAGSSDNGILVTGLPDTVTVITVGQGFVTVGQQVNPVAQSSALENNSPYERAD